jgi:DinB superfamily
LTYHPAPGAWSILDCVERIATAESVMFVLIARRSPPVASPAEGREDKYFRGSLNRARKFSAPDSLRPSQRYASLEAALDAFAEWRGRTIRYIEEGTGDLRSRTTIHPVDDYSRDLPFPGAGFRGAVGGAGEIGQPSRGRVGPPWQGRK